ncbi:TIR domain-containing protein [Nephila pilipes]|uniref:TIR domain-containing protein n=1 Tax=Nephila pilipes TaxID=299642 RepID=A0A8X6PTB5_NEPPI|nr:TIR domain-containing protein [Nephila pilipes]
MSCFKRWLAELLFSGFTEMDEEELRDLIGIRLKSDNFVFPNDSDQVNQGVIIGSVTHSSISLKCSELRKLLYSKKIPFMPVDFQFLSKDGWPIEKTDEENVAISQLLKSGIVTIRKYFDTPFLGIRWEDDKPVGFIYVNFNSFLSDVRIKIHEDLGDKLQGSDFEFFAKTIWPVCRAQESELTLWDICNENFCVIKKLSNDSKPVNNSKHFHPRKRPRLLNKSPVRKPSLLKNSNLNSILISYVHSEASMHARNLKDELQNMGFDSVFLDIDDIPPGMDWQEIINTALNNCTAFVALVTPRYGETKWTNREAKLADAREKHIIPVSFLDTWPPDHLAIQFLTLQYIPWKTVDEVDNGISGLSSDITSWDQRCVHRVAKEIKKICTEQDVSTPDSISLLDPKPYLQNGSASFYSPKDSLENKTEIVISAHSEQKQFAEKIMKVLREKGYEVWSSVDITDTCGDIDLLCDDSHSQSPVFDSYSHDKAYANAISLNKSNCYSSCSEIRNGSTSGKSSDYENLKAMKVNFKKKVKEASFVIVVMSEEYNKSQICLQQAYFCEQRVDVIVIKYGEFQIDNIILNFFPEQDMLSFTGAEDEENNSFLNIIKEITKTLQEGKIRKSYKDHIQKMVEDLSSKLKIEENSACVYVIGGTSGVSKNAEQFCIHLGAELAKLPGLNLVTEGFFGAGDLVGRNFCEEKEIRAKGQKHSIYHVIPHKDHNIINNKARQRDDGTFEKIPYGQTLFFGNSISERDDIVSSTFKICLLIEGGERSACLAEKFLWNDCKVIPVIFKNRAIASKRCLAASLSKVPSGVSPCDWSVLNDFETPDALAKTVRKIVSQLLKRALSNDNILKGKFK